MSEKSKSRTFTQLQILFQGDRPITNKSNSQLPVTLLQSVEYGKVFGLFYNVSGNFELDFYQQSIAADY